MAQCSVLTFRVMTAPSRDEIDLVLQRALSFLAAEQDNSGGFLSLSSVSPNFTPSFNYSTTFHTSLILACLKDCEDLVANAIKHKAKDFLLAQKSPYWSFNYWNRHSSQFVDLPYPDDLDDTFCALGALATTEPSLITGQALAKIVALLTTQETKPGGPYRTWLVDHSAAEVWQDVDLAVNSNIAWFLKQQRVVLPGLNEFLESRLDGSEYTSPYYPSVYPLLYFLSRGYSGSKQAKMMEYLLNQRMADGTWGSILPTALSVSSLLRCGLETSDLDSAVEYLLQSSASGNFRAEPFCWDPSLSGQRYYSGSQALTTAFLIEALVLHKDYAQKQMQRETPPVEMYNSVTTQVQKRLDRLPEPLRSHGHTVLQSTLRKDTDRQIVLLPYWFAQACELPEQNNLLTNLGAANLYGWIAYTIYDNVMDEARQVQSLPLANVCLREVVSIYQKHTPQPFHELLTHVLDQQEAVNLWELTETRNWPQQLPNYGDYSVLADKSFGHALGPLAVLSHLGFANDSADMNLAIKMFRHYLIARQLNDDAHDWQADFRQGQVNSVAAYLLRFAGNQPGQADVAQILPQLQELFWQQTINEVSELVLHHTFLARDYSQQLSTIKNNAFFLDILKPLEAAANRAVKESTLAKDFLASYGN